jgi:AcrR family transcriptional regulator
MKTRDKIVATALALFNAQGERNVTTNHIAAELNMSPGNLYYHFKNKEAIIREIFESYSVELLADFSPVDGENDTLVLLKRYLDCIFTLMWKYRFFYANLPQILQRDEILHTKYLVVQNRSQINLHHIFNSFIELKLITIKTTEVKALVTSLHLVIFSWLSYQLTMSLNSTVTEKVIYQGMIQMITIIKPYTTALGNEQLRILESTIHSLSE